VFVDGIGGTAAFAKRLQGKYTHGVLFSVSYADIEFGGAMPQPRALEHTSKPACKKNQPAVKPFLNVTGLPR
jgi:hypothetical protein